MSSEQLYILKNLIESVATYQNLALHLVIDESQVEAYLIPIVYEEDEDDEDDTA